MLIYPVDRTQAPDASLPPLPHLLGSTCAALLHAAASLACATNSELADATGMGVPGVSRQLAVLSGSGLVTSPRDGKPGHPRYDSLRASPSRPTLMPPRCLGARADRGNDRRFGRSQKQARSALGPSHHCRGITTKPH